MVAAMKRPVAHCNIAHSEALWKSFKFEETIVHAESVQIKVWNFLKLAYLWIFGLFFDQVWLDIVHEV